MFSRQFGFAHKPAFQRTKYSTPVVIGALLAAQIAYVSWQLFRDVKIKADAPKLIDLKSKATPDGTWKPDTSVEPFSRTIVIDDKKYALLGLGVRTVSFLKIHVYAVGVYVAEDDLDKLISVVKNDSKDGDVRNALFESNSILIESLLEHNIKIGLRIVPVRNTDFSHLRDGFIRSINQTLKIKGSYSADVDASEGVTQLRSLFSRKKSVPKNGELLLVKNDQGELQCSYADGRHPNKEHLGDVKDSIVINALFLHYLTGPNAASEQARLTFIDSVDKLASSGELY
ncbi:chalcone-flavanone isomerase-domain-containing protein [Lipomyces japonicus]|uniref:chalcone-flavanone isomerase-domain-containing protein n=1 Tax=Lipomyces japonicus TaxID=56871 RepID=UPI0034CEB674